MVVAVKAISDREPSDRIEPLRCGAQLGVSVRSNWASVIPTKSEYFRLARGRIGDTLRFTERKWRAEWGRLRMTDDVARDRVGDVLTGLRDQLADIAAMQKNQAALRVDGQAAEGAVEITVDARGQVVKTVIDKSYLDDHDFEELGDYITEAARAAAAEAGRRVAEMLAPINERHRKLPSFSDIVEGLPDRSDVMAPALEMLGQGPRPQEDSAAAVAGARYDDGDGEAEFPTVRK